MIETASAWWECVKVAAVRELWRSVQEREESDTVGRAMVDSERHAAWDRAAIEGRTVFLRSFKASLEGALGTILVYCLVVGEQLLADYSLRYRKGLGMKYLLCARNENVLLGSGSIVVMPKSGV